MGKKRILIFAHYYPPDIAATGQILKDQAEGMLDEFDVTVICVVPSYGGTIAKEYKTQKYYLDELNDVKLIRVRVPEFTKSNKLSRIKNIVVYFFRALLACSKAGKQDYIFTISQPPILGGVLGFLGKWMKRAKMIYCIQDFNPEQIIAVNYSSNKLLLKAMMLVDKFSCRQSDLIVTVGRDLVETLRKRFNGKRIPKYIMINNWVDEKQIYPLPADDERVLAFKRQYGLENKFVIMYSGNIGLYYDLENIMKVIQKFKPGTKAPDGREVVFAFVGGGSIKEKLVLYKKENHMDNVVFIPYQAREDLIYSLNAGDVHWVMNAKGIKGVSCPSKYYGICACGKPVLGVLERGSEIRILIEETRGGLVCEPEEDDQIEKNIKWFIDFAGGEEVAQMSQNGYEYLKKNLTQDMSVRKYIEAIKRL